MGSVTITIYPVDGSDPITTKTDENGNEITAGYYDEFGNYVTVYFDAVAGTDVTRTTDPWGYYSLELMVNGAPEIYYYDN